jgi:hypothetical protein
MRVHSVRTSATTRDVTTDAQPISDARGAHRAPVDVIESPSSSRDDTRSRMRALDQGLQQGTSIVRNGANFVWHDTRDPVEGQRRTFTAGSVTELLSLVQEAVDCGSCDFRPAPRNGTTTARPVAHLVFHPDRSNTSSAQRSSR